MRNLRSIGDTDSGLLGALMTFPWLAGDVTADEQSGLLALDTVALNDVESARYMAALLWFEDGLDEHERNAINGISRLIASEDDLDRRLVELVVNAGWFADGVRPA